MAHIYPFPTIEDRRSAETALSTFLAVQSGKARNMMYLALKKILQRYHLSRLNLRRCVIEINSEDEVVIKPKKFIASPSCPGCGENLYAINSKVRILSICEGKSSDIVTYGCYCGEIFGKVETNGN